MSEELDWSKCPFCGGENIEAGDYDMSGNQLWFNIDCQDCHEYWEEVYTATQRERDGKVIK